MASTFMNLTLPDVSVTPGPEWASLLNAALTAVDSHDHTSGKGTKITQAGINITGSMAWNAFPITGLGYATYSNLTTLVATSITNTVYVKSGDLYFNDSSGNQVRLTAGGTVNVSSVAGIGGDYASTAASAFYTDALLTYFFQDSSAARALLDARILRTTTTYSSNQTLSYTIDNAVLVSGNTTLALPAVASSTGIEFYVKKTDSNATTVTLDPNGAELIDGAASYTLVEIYESVHLYCDGSAWYIL